MTPKEILEEQIIFGRGQKIDALYLIVRGVVNVDHPGGRHMLRCGDIVGLCELDGDEAFMNYKVDEKVSAIAYSLKNKSLSQALENIDDTRRFFLSSAFRQMNMVIKEYKYLKAECLRLYDYVTGSYKNYVELCEFYRTSPGQPEGYEEFGKLALEEDVPTWIAGYYASLEQMLTAWDSNKATNEFVCGFLIKASQDIHHLVWLCNQMQQYRNDGCKILMNENELDFLELFVVLYGKAARKDGLEGERVIALRKIINDRLMLLEKHGLGDTELYLKRKEIIEGQFREIEKHCTQPEEAEQGSEQLRKEIADSLDEILAYAKCDQELEDSFRRHIGKYKKTINKNGTEEEIRVLRQCITREFYQVYTAAFKNSLQDKKIPAVVKMFFNFGYVDEELAGMNNALYMRRIIDQLPTSPEEGVYSFYEWLTAVYEGKKEPSRNEFDLDYIAYLHEEKKMGRITQEEESALAQDNFAKVVYELENVFPMVNKMTFGRISTFCPVFSEHNVMKDLEGTLVSKDKIKEILENLRKKDFGAYYRETLYTNPEQGVSKEFINIEILPDFILTPNVGIRGVMWQEIEGKRRNTPARMLSSIFQMEDLALIITRLTGEFRWEMCKRIQGARWNDLSERSLTSEYFDYIQFYRRNQELSSDSKDKIKNDMARAKNSFKEMFIMDYVIWISYESNGSPRLNKVARNILFNYCAFSAEIREKLKANPMYRELAEKYEIRMGQKRHRMDNLYRKLSVQGKGIPEEIEKEKQFLYM